MRQSKTATLLTGPCTLLFTTSSQQVRHMGRNHTVLQQQNGTTITKVCFRTRDLHGNFPALLVGNPTGEGNSVLNTCGKGKLPYRKRLLEKICTVSDEW